eukprot:729293-Amphidinium_carterae.2
MTGSFKAAYHKTVIFPIIGNLGSNESTRRSKFFLGSCDMETECSRETIGAATAPVTYGIKAYHRDFESPQMLIAMTLPLGNDKQRF